MNSSSHTDLPNDIDTLKALVLKRERELTKKDEILVKNESSLSKKSKHIKHLEQVVRYLKLKQYGKSSERYISPDQETLFNEAEELFDQNSEPSSVAQSTDSELDQNTDSNESPNSSTKTAKKRAGRRPLPSDLPRHKIYHTLAEKDQVCSCGCERKIIDEVTSEQLGVIPAQLYVIQHCRQKAVCPSCTEQAPVTAKLPAQPLPKSNASPELLAHISVSKFLDGLPFYRQEKIWERLDIQLPRATQASWMMGAGQLTQALINVMVEYQQTNSVIHIDETPVQVLKEPDKPPEGKKYFWLTVGGPPDKTVFRYHYDPSRGAAVAEELLQGFNGAVMSDDWQVYARVCEKNQLTHIACNDHARRKFKDALNDIPKNKRKGISKPEMALNYYRKLYAVEARIKGLSDGEKLKERQQISAKLWADFTRWIEKHLQTVTPASKLGKALHYTYKLKDKLSYYCEDGALPISNQIAENAIRPFAIARKNFLFYDTPKGAAASANLYSLIITAKHHGLNPFYYLAYVFAQLPLARTVDDVEALLPWRLDNEALKQSVERF